MTGQPPMPQSPTPVQHDTIVHVAQFLQEGIGAWRRARLALDALPLDDESPAREIEAELKLTRIPAGILAEGQFAATVTLECVRCLEQYDERVRGAFADEYRPTIDVVSGADLALVAEGEDEVDCFPIDDTHLLDLRESLRQAIVLALPMVPRCREDCPGLGEVGGALGEGGDARLAILAQLLGEGDGADGAGEAPGATRRAGR